MQSVAVDVAAGDEVSDPRGLVPEDLHGQHRGGNAVRVVVPIDEDVAEGAPGAPELRRPRARRPEVQGIQQLLETRVHPLSDPIRFRAVVPGTHLQDHRRQLGTLKTASQIPGGLPNLVKFQVGIRTDRQQRYIPLRTAEKGPPPKTKWRRAGPPGIDNFPHPTLKARIPDCSVLPKNTRAATKGTPPPEPPAVPGSDGSGACPAECRKGIPRRRPWDPEPRRPGPRCARSRTPRRTSDRAPASRRGRSP